MPASTFRYAMSKLDIAHLLLRLVELTINLDCLESYEDSVSKDSLYNMVLEHPTVTLSPVVFSKRPAEDAEVQ